MIFTFLYSILEPHSTHDQSALGLVTRDCNGTTAPEQNDCGHLNALQNVLHSSGSRQRGHEQLKNKFLITAKKGLFR